MSLLIQYLVKLTISLAIVWLFYQFVLRRLTFYNSNRCYLLAYTLLSFFIPFINISTLFENRSNEIFQFMPSVHQYTIELEEATQCPAPIWSTFDKWDLIAFGLITVAGFLFIRFVISYFSFLRIQRKAKLISEDGVKIYQVNENIIPFSFGNSIFINSNLHAPSELEEIVKHEFVHVRQKHTIDIIWAELLCIINWYNPFAWLLRRSMRQNLEFIADDKVIRNGFNKKEYQYLLLKVIGNKQFSIATQFNFSSLKKRIAMMNKLKTAKVHMLRFLFLLPLVAILLLAFRDKLKEPISIVKDYKSKKEVDKTVIQVNPDFSIEATVIKKDTLPQKANSKGFFIDIIDNKGNCTVVVKDKNKKEVKRLLLTEWNTKKEHYEDLYGEILPATLELDEVVEETESEDMAEVKEVTVVGKPITATTVTLAPTVKEVVVVGKPSTTVAVNPDLKEVTVVGYPAKIATTVNSKVAADVKPLIESKVVAPVSTTIYPTTIGEVDISVTIKNTTKPEELESFISKLKEKGYELTFNNKNYENGILTELSGTVKYKGNSSTFSFSGFDQATIAVYRDGDDVYFRTYTGKKRARS